MPDGLRGKDKVPDVVVQILAGQELGLSPMASIRGVHIVQGKPILSADTMVALILGSGLCEYFICSEETDTKVTFETKRKGAPQPQRFTWSDEDTKIAGLNTKDSWRLYKRQMRRARCRAVLARDVYPDVLAGCYDPDEIPSESIRQPLAVVADREPDATDAEIVSETPASSLIEQIRNTATLDDLMALAAKCNALPPKSAERNQARAEFDAQKARLVKPVGVAAP
jgi:hypothetical protein